MIKKTCFNIVDIKTDNNYKTDDDNKHIKQTSILKSKKTLEKEEYTYLSDIQNYLPIYKRFFSLNEKNYNSFNLNHTLYLKSIKYNYENSKNLYYCNLKNLERLHLNNNQLSSLPAKIGKLINLKELHLKNNQLKSICIL